MTPRAQLRWLRVSVVLALAGLALVVWSLLDPAPVPVIVSMTVGQVVGTASLAIYLAVVAVDLRLARRLWARARGRGAGAADGRAAPPKEDAP